MVPGTLPAQPSRQSTSQLPEAPQVLCAEPAAPPTPQGHEQEVPLPLAEINEVLPVDRIGLGRGGDPGVPPRLQYAQPAHPPQEPQLPPLGLQLQLEAGQDP